MPRLSLLLAALLIAVTRLIVAQQVPPTRPTSPVPLVPAPDFDPTVHPDNSVTFDLLMPHAEHVELQVEGAAKPFLMEHSAANPGHWTYTVPPLAPEYYSYSFLVDGTNVVDPHNVLTKPSAFRVQSLFLVPGHQLWESRDVPHGIVHRHDYTSAIVQRSSIYYVYTRPISTPPPKRNTPSSIFSTATATKPPPGPTWPKPTSSSTTLSPKARPAP